MSWSTSELRVRLAPLNRFKPSSKIFCWLFQGGTSFVDLLCFCSVLCLLCLCASVYMCFVVTCWERADLLALVCGVFCEFVTFPLVSWVRCGTWLYRFLIFAPLLTSKDERLIFYNITRCYSDGEYCHVFAIAAGDIIEFQGGHMIRNADARTVQSRQETFNSNGRHDAWFGDFTRFLS